MGDCKALSLVTSKEPRLQLCPGIDLPDLTGLQQGRATQAPQKSQREIAASRSFQPFRLPEIGSNPLPRAAMLEYNCC